MRNPETEQLHLHHHFCVVEKLKEVVFKLHLDEILHSTADINIKANDGIWSLVMFNYLTL